MTADVVQCRACLALAKSGQTTTIHAVGPAEPHQRTERLVDLGDAVDAAAWRLSKAQSVLGSFQRGRGELEDHGAAGLVVHLVQEAVESLTVALKDWISVCGHGDAITDQDPRGGVTDDAVDHDPGGREPVVGDRFGQVEQDVQLSRGQGVLGLSRRQYASQYGWSVDTARAILASEPRAARNAKESA